MAQRFNTHTSTHGLQTGYSTKGNLALRRPYVQPQQPQQSQQQNTHKQRRQRVYHVKAIAVLFIVMCVLIAVCGSILLTGLHHWWLSSCAQSAEQMAYAYNWNEELTDEFLRAQDAVRQFGNTSWLAAVSVWLGHNAFTKLIRMAIYGIATLGLGFSIFGIGPIVLQCILEIYHGKAKARW